MPENIHDADLGESLKQQVSACLSEAHLKDPAVMKLLALVRDTYRQLGAEREGSAGRQASQALKRSEERYRNMIERSSDIIYKSDGMGYFTYVNPVAERITGYKQEELLNKHFSELIMPERRQQAIDFYQEQFSGKKKSTYYEFPVITKEGREIWIGQSVQLSDSGNGRVEFTALAIDITERKNYERHIFLQKEKYLNIITNMNLGLVEVDTDERIQFANKSFSLISGYGQEELIGKKASELFVPDSHAHILREKARKRAEGVSDLYEIPVKNKSGELRWWMVSGTPNYDEQGNFIGSIGIHLDITEKKQMELELEFSRRRAEESSNAKAAFLANMSHEIRTPLNGIIGMIRELSYETLPDKQREYVDNASVASEHLLSVLNNVLDISKIEAGELSLERHHFKLKGTIREVKTIMKQRAREKGLLLGLDVYDIKGVTYIGDSARIRQILLNLIGNAIKFTDKGGVYVECKIRERKPGSHTIALSVEDTGIGMEGSYLDKLFRKFSQEDASISRRYGGTGLGMAITHEIIKLMNGTVTVESKKNEGTRIEVVFDLLLGQEEAPGPERETSVDREAPKTRVLLVEDNAFNRAVACNTLRRHTCEVTEAVNGADAVALLGEHTFDVVLMDLQMPVMDGFEAMRRIRQELRLDVPVIALTANAFKSELEQCIAAGMNECITKPFEESRLVGAVKRLHRLEESKTSPPETPTGSLLYDLGQLKELAGNDQAFIQKMIRLFIEQARLSLDQINAASERGALAEVSAIAHRIKPSLDSLAVSSLQGPIRLIEERSGSGSDLPVIKEQLLLLNSFLPQVILQLEKELL